MRLNIKNPKVVLYFTITTFNIILVSILRPIIRKKSKKLKIILYSHKLNGNIKSLLDYVKKEKLKDVEIAYITIDYPYYRQLKKDGVNVLSSQKITDIIKLFNSDVIVTTHGPSAFYLIKKFGIKSPKFVDVWHGISFKGLVPLFFKYYHPYDKICAPSDYFRNLYITRWGFRKNQVVTTGWGRVDYYFNDSLKKEEILNKYKIDKKFSQVVLITPTFKSDDKNRSIFPFNTTDKEFFGKIEKIGNDKNTLFIFRTHVNTDYNPKMRYNHIKFFSQKDYPLTYEILYITDILVVDWSSIANDFLTLNRHIIHLDVPAPYKYGFTFTPKDRVGYIVKNMNELEKSLTHCLDNPKEFPIKFKRHREEVLKMAYDNNLDGKSAGRYLKVIRRLVGKPSPKKKTIRHKNLNRSSVK